MFAHQTKSRFGDLQGELVGLVLRQEVLLSRRLPIRRDVLDEAGLDQIRDGQGVTGDRMTQVHFHGSNVRSMEG